MTRQDIIDQWEDIIDQWEDIHGDRQCGVCGDWLEVTGSLDRPCGCGLVKDDYARTHLMAINVARLTDSLSHWPLADLVTARHNLTRLAVAAARAVEAIDRQIADMEPG